MFRLQFNTDLDIILELYLSNGLASIYAKECCIYGFYAC